MFKLPLILLLVSSAFFYHANVAGSELPKQNASAPQSTQTSEKPSNLALASSVALPKENETAKGEQITTKPSEHNIPPHVTEEVLPSPNTSVIPIKSSTSPTSPPSPSPTTTPKPSPSPTTTPKPSPSSTTTPKPSPSPTTTPKPSPSPTTAPPKPSPSPSPSPHPTPIPPPTPTTVGPKPSSDGGFNLISFLGGMILGLGLLAIGYVVFKFYQTRRDSSYRTL